MIGPQGWRALRIAIGAVLVLVLGVSLLAIFVSGPIVPVPTALDLEPRASSDRLRRDVERLCREFGPRDIAHPENLSRAAEWIAEEFRATGLDVEFQDYDLAEGTFRNVIAVQRGYDTSRPAFVVGAHYDAFGEHCGADDNASGVAVLLEIVRTLPWHAARSTRYYVAFSTEEPPAFGTERMGSHVFARSLHDRGEEVGLMLALDMVGYYTDEPGSQHFPFPGLSLLYPDRGDFVAVVGDTGTGDSIRRIKRDILATRSIPVQSFRAPTALAPVHLSDHISFRRLGMPGVQITDTSFMRFPHYHTASDTPEKLDYERMVRLVHGLQGVLWEGEPQAP